jgi:cytochrome c oxidase subunit 3
VSRRPNAVLETTEAHARQQEIVGEPYDTVEQQHDTAEFGMWIFLATELMLFGGLFTAYTVYRTVYPDGFAEGSRHMDLFYGAPNTVILLLSSLTMALGVRASQLGERRSLFRYLVITAVLGVIFMLVKGAEYLKHYQDGMVPGLNWEYAGANANAVQLFFVGYFVMTGLHAIHLLIAIGIVVVTAVLARRGTFEPPERHTPVEMVGLYWHFVDMIWTFLFPLLYLFGFNA